MQRLPAFARAKRLACYLPFDGEPDLRSLMEAAHASGRHVYLPVLQGEALHFVSWHPKSRLARNHLGILEPRGGRVIDPRQLDLVLCPVLGYDRRGTRLGYGGGYYDRCFRFLLTRSCWLRPKLIGIAFAFQGYEHIARQPWDVALWAAVTEAGCHLFCCR